LRRNGLGSQYSYGSAYGGQLQRACASLIIALRPDDIGTAVHVGALKA
jgi:hypothetical protein